MEFRGEGMGWEKNRDKFYFWSNLDGMEWNEYGIKMEYTIVTTI